MAVAEQRAGRPGYAELEALVAEQAAVIASLRAEVAELRGRLDQSSRNSSRPPSSDGYEKPAPRSLRRRSGRKPGGQPGSPGHRLQRSEQPDESVLHRAERCDGCGGDLGDAAIEGSESRQVFDLPELPRLGCVEHWIQRRRCGCCGEVTSSRFPVGVNAPVQYGPRVRALGIYLVCYQHLPYERAAQLLSDVLGARGVCRQPCRRSSRRAPGAWTGSLTSCAASFKGARVAQFDETGARIDGKLGWVHSASTVALTLYVTHPRRGVDGIDAVGVLPGFAGTAVHDGWAPYRAYEHATHALCNAHHFARADWRRRARAGVGAGDELPAAGRQGAG